MFHNKRTRLDRAESKGHTLCSDSDKLACTLRTPPWHTQTWEEEAEFISLAGLIGKQLAQVDAVGLKIVITGQCCVDPWPESANRPLYQGDVLLQISNVTDVLRPLGVLACRRISTALGPLADLANRIAASELAAAIHVPLSSMHPQALDNHMLACRTMLREAKQKLHKRAVIERRLYWISRVLESMAAAHTPLLVNLVTGDATTEDGAVAKLGQAHSALARLTPRNVPLALSARPRLFTKRVLASVYALALQHARDTGLGTDPAWQLMLGQCHALTTSDPGINSLLEPGFGAAMATLDGEGDSKAEGKATVACAGDVVVWVPTPRKPVGAVGMQPGKELRHESQLHATAHSSNILGTPEIKKWGQIRRTLLRLAQARVHVVRLRQSPLPALLALSAPRDCACMTTLPVAAELPRLLPRTLPQALAPLGLWQMHAVQVQLNFMVAALLEGDLGEGRYKLLPAVHDMLWALGDAGKEVWHSGTAQGGDSALSVRPATRGCWWELENAEPYSDTSSRVPTSGWQRRDDYDHDGCEVQLTPLNCVALLSWHSYSQVEAVLQQLQRLLAETQALDSAAGPDARRGGLRGGRGDGRGGPQAPAGGGRGPGRGGRAGRGGRGPPRDFWEGFPPYTDGPPPFLDGPPRFRDDLPPFLDGPPRFHDLPVYRRRPPPFPEDFPFLDGPVPPPFRAERPPPYGDDMPPFRHGGPPSPNWRWGPRRHFRPPYLLDGPQGPLREPPPPFRDMAPPFDSPPPGRRYRSPPPGYRHEAGLPPRGPRAFDGPRGFDGPRRSPSMFELRMVGDMNGPSIGDGPLHLDGVRDVTQERSGGARSGPDNTRILDEHTGFHGRKRGRGGLPFDDPPKPEGPGFAEGQGFGRRRRGGPPREGGAVVNGSSAVREHHSVRRGASGGHEGLEYTGAAPSAVLGQYGQDVGPLRGQADPDRVYDPDFSLRRELQVQEPLRYYGDGVRDDYHDGYGYEPELREQGGAMAQALYPPRVLGPGAGHSSGGPSVALQAPLLTGGALNGIAGNGPEALLQSGRQYVQYVEVLGPVSGYGRTEADGRGADGHGGAYGEAVRLGPAGMLSLGYVPGQSQEQPEEQRLALYSHGLVDRQQGGHEHYSSEPTTQRGGGANDRMYGGGSFYGRDGPSQEGPTGSATQAAIGTAATYSAQGPYGQTAAGPYVYVVQGEVAGGPGGTSGTGGVHAHYGYVSGQGSGSAPQSGYGSQNAGANSAWGYR